MEFPTTPMANCTKIIPWLENEDLCYIRNGNVLLETAIDVLQSRVCSWNYHDFKLLYKRADTTPLWNSMSVDLTTIYYDVPTSLQLLISFLEFQFNNDRESIVDFLQTVHNVCERSIPKLNSVCVFSSPSAGKNWYFDMILAFYWNKGQLGNPNRNNQFAYQEAVSKRILLWNEPNYEPIETEMLKMVLGGDNYTVKVKHKQDMAVYRTPVIVLTNTWVPFMSDEAFKDRCRNYRWHTCPMLKDKMSKPNPLSYIDLLEYYEIE